MIRDINEDTTKYRYPRRHTNGEGCSFRNGNCKINEEILDALDRLKNLSVVDKVIADGCNSCGLVHVEDDEPYINYVIQHEGNYDKIFIGYKIDDAGIEGEKILRNLDSMEGIEAECNDIPHDKIKVSVSD